jgi:hypothetical protein
MASWRQASFAPVSTGTASPLTVKRESHLNSVNTPRKEQFITASVASDPQMRTTPTPGDLSTPSPPLVHTPPSLSSAQRYTNSAPSGPPLPGSSGLSPIFSATGPPLPGSFGVTSPNPGRLPQSSNVDSFSAPPPYSVVHRQPPNTVSSSSSVASSVSSVASSASSISSTTAPSLPPSYASVNIQGRTTAPGPPHSRNLQSAVGPWTERLGPMNRGTKLSEIEISRLVQDLICSAAILTVSCPLVNPRSQYCAHTRLVQSANQIIMIFYGAR